MAQEAMAMVGIDEFVEGLKRLPQMKSEAVNAYLKANPVKPETLKPYLFFSPANYTRNLIFKNELFELLALCWEVGQVSRIHNHRDQQCWMAVPIGKLKAQNFRVLDRDAKKCTCRLEPTSSFLITPASPAEVDQDEPVHQVLNLAEWNEPAASLHIYARPFNTCEVYSLENGTYGDVPLYCTSEYGKVCREEGANVRR
ncbi:cysteine dioxygenase family protein [Acidobacteriia bacterium AH_259_A11_L15]|nr:cysteine dioxygenase family protein [Acidobacteriia bacterium AH_259_A11_L15]